ncbi:MAG: prepilin-type N-terminal cleavage/methylation domain-containing protein [Proteobacteria bacterium]|nr:prepilin-type N-terminal cleavage/methylation domain-containing protein [Pseudomonadota bacterium]HQR02574.1 prepilin-type N-terminal cleavage/methylation domain-containing protein [Rhodocyclaceae bacterium]
MSRHPNLENGYTLIEVMVVMAIIALMAAAIMMRIPPHRTPENEIDRLCHVLETAALQSEIKGVTLAVDFVPQGYLVSQLAMSGGWRPLTNRAALSSRSVPDLAWGPLTVNGSAAAQRIVFSGGMPDFSMTVTDPSGATHIAGNPTGIVTRIPQGG